MLLVEKQNFPLPRLPPILPPLSGNIPKKRPGFQPFFRLTNEGKYGMIPLVKFLGFTLLREEASL